MPVQIFAWSTAVFCEHQHAIHRKTAMSHTCIFWNHQGLLRNQVFQGTTFSTKQSFNSFSTSILSWFFSLYKPCFEYILAPLYIDLYYFKSLWKVILLFKMTIVTWHDMTIHEHVFLHRENFPSHFKFKEYCPLVFRQLRERFGIDDNQYAVSS